MKITQRLQAAVQGFRTANNSVGDNLGRQFLRYGNRRDPLVQDWSQLLMQEEDKYTGYSYGAIDRRAKKVAWLASYNLKTTADQTILDLAKKNDEIVAHPYLSIIDKSTTFSNWSFWYEIQTYLDLKGIYYLLAVRNFSEGRTRGEYGEVQEFKLLNPYEITRIYSTSDTTQIVGYVENRDGMQRELPPHMIIPISTLNPFSRTEPFAMADAAKDSQFTLKQAGDQMRGVLTRNKKFPGVVMIGDDEIALDDEQLENFKARMMGSKKPGEPIFTVGKDGLNWNDMQVDLRKSIPKEVNEIQLNGLIAATGVSRTKFGIEQSGVTRDTAEIQDDQFIADQAMPALQLIVDALNQDYKTKYPDKFKSDGYKLYIDSPLGVDRDAEVKDLEIREKSYEIYTTLINKGYDRELAAKYADGKIGLDELGEPTNDPVPVVDKPTETTTTVIEDEETKEVENSIATNTAKRQIKEVTFHDYPEVYESLGIDTDKLGYVMLDVEPFDVTKYVDSGEEDLFFSEEAGSYKLGAVAEKTAHVTLMFGLLENSNKLKKEIDTVLDTWQVNKVQIDNVGSFPSRDGDAVPIVAHVKLSDALVEGNNRLKLLPHIDTFPEYRPHITLAYVKNSPDIVNKWVKSLGKVFGGTTLSVKDNINYGDNSAVGYKHPGHLPAVKNQFDEDQQGLVATQQGYLQNTIVNIEERLTSAVINKVSKNEFESQTDILSQQEQNDFEDELEMALAAFYAIIIPLYASNVLGRRSVEFGLTGEFKLNNAVKEQINSMANKAAASHINTVLNDLLKTIKATYDKRVQTELRGLLEAKAAKLPASEAEEFLKKPVNKASDIYKLAQRKALEGSGQQEIISAIKQEYKDISTNRAKAIARSETNRAFAQSQYQADAQFIQQNNLQGRAYKKWITRSGNPCALCAAKAAEGPIPFNQAFANLGDELTATYEEDGKTKVLKQKITYETVQSGSLHTNCACIYQLIIEAAV